MRSIRPMETGLVLALLASFGCSTLQDAPDVRSGYAPAGLSTVGDGTEPMSLAPAAPSIVDTRTMPTVDRNAPKKAPVVKKRLRPRLPIPDELADNMRAASAFLPPQDGVQVLPDEPQIDRLAPALGLSFDSLDGLDNSGGFVPPDPEMAVGQNHVVVAVNSVFAIYNKNTGALEAGPIAFDTFFNSVGCSGTFDPNALYDEEHDRYFIGIDANNGTRYCFGASDDGNPNGSWAIYSIVTATGGDFFDYPHAGVGDDAIFMGANTFLSAGGVRADLWAFDKADMYAGTSVSFVTGNIAGDTPQPMNLHGFAQGTWPTDGIHYILNDFVFNGSTVGVFAWEDPFGLNSLSLVGTVSLNTATGVTAGSPIDMPQSGGGDIQGNDFRIQDAEYRNGHIWTTQTIGCNPGQGTVNCIRWAEIAPSGAGAPKVIQAGVFASTLSHRAFADLGVNHCGDMTIGYTRTSSSLFPAVWYTGRLSTDTPGLVQAEALLKAGEVTYVAFDTAPRRWGDYTGGTSDPDGIRTWYLGEYSKNTGSSVVRWGNWVGEFSTPCVDIFKDGFESGDVTRWTGQNP